MPIGCLVVPNFALLCEWTRQPHLRDQPLALEREGRICTVCRTAAARGVAPGQSASGARALTAALAILPYDRPFYEEAAERIWDVLAVESSVVEPISPEVAYLELGRDAPALLQNLADRIRGSLGVPVYAGLAFSKLLAHRAAQCCRDRRTVEAAGRRLDEIQSGETQPPQSGVVVVFPGAEAQYLADMPLDDAPGVDKAARSRLARLGIGTLGGLAKIPPAELQRQFGALALKLRRIAQGEDNDPVRALWPRPSLDASYRFEPLDGFLEDSVDQRTVDHALGCCAADLARLLQARRTFCRIVALYVVCADGVSLQQTERLDCAVNDAPRLHAAARRLLGRMGLQNIPAHLKLTVSELGQGESIQLALLDRDGLDTERSRKLDAAVAELRDQFGIGAVGRGMGMAPKSRRMDLYTFAYVHRCLETVDVTVNERGEPVTLTRAGRWGRVYDQQIVAIRDMWRETQWIGGIDAECEELSLPLSKSKSKSASTSKSTLRGGTASIPEKHSASPSTQQHSGPLLRPSLPRSTWTVYRVEIAPSGFVDLYHLAHDEWQLRAVDD